MGFNEYEKFDAIGLAELIKKKEVSPLEVMESCIDRINERNPKLNAVIATNYDKIYEIINKTIPEGPLGGVPFLLKDLNTHCVDMPATNGCAAFKEFYPKKDSILVSRYKIGGLVILGKTNTPELGLNISTEPNLFGPTRNPYNLSYSSGGSSGGSAAAVASGMVPAAHATDSAGSIRIPASNCGLFGLKPTRSRVPLGNDMSEGMSGFSTVNAVSHTVRDSALLLDIAAGRVTGDPFVTPTINATFLNTLRQPLKNKSVAFWTKGFAGESVDSECVKATKEVVIKCETLGCNVEEACPDIDGFKIRKAIDVIFSVNISKLVSNILKKIGSNGKSLFEPVTLACAKHGEKYKAGEFVEAVKIISKTGHKMEEFFQIYDFILTPTLAKTPLIIGALDMKTDDWNIYLKNFLDVNPFSPLFNATGCPAASVPLYKSAKGLPVGVQIGASFGSEDSILQLAGALEEAWCWHHFKINN